MSATLKWKPVRPEGKSLSGAAKFFFREAYERVNDGEIKLSASDAHFLAGASAATKDNELKADIKTLLEAIEKFGEVEVWQEF